MTPLSTTLWAATAPQAPVTAPLDADTSADVTVIGAGYAGLSTAIHLAELGMSVQVLEAGEIGTGASGRSGGQVIPGIKYDPENMLRLFGEDAGKLAISHFGSTAKKVFGLIDRYGIECDDTRSGWVQPAHTPGALKIAHDRCRQWKDTGADVAPLSRAEISDMLGTDKYYGGWIDRRAGSVQPLSYTRGLAKAALGLGVRIATRTPVETIKQEGNGWEARVKAGHAVRSSRVVVCTNAYSKGLWPGLEQTYIAANSFQVATHPLDPEQGEEILKGGVVASDTRRLLAYFRRDREGRFIMGGRGTFSDPTGPEEFAHVGRMLTKNFPQLADEKIQYRWGGRVAITQDFLPHVHEPEAGIMFLVGCQGRGVAMQSKMGEWLAKYIETGGPDTLPLPVTPIRPIPFHQLRRLYVSATIAYYKFRDLVG